MGKGIIQVAPDVVGSWYAAGKTVDDIKELLYLPDSFQVDKVESIESIESGIIVFVSSPAILDTLGKGQTHTLIRPKRDRDENGRRLPHIEIYPLDAEPSKPIERT